MAKQDFFINGTNRNQGAVIDMTAEAANFNVVGVEYFFICIESAAPIEVILNDGSLFTITTVQATAYLGLWIPLAIKEVIKVGTTGTFSFGF